MEQFLGNSVLVFMEVALIIFSGFYIIFAIIVLKQVYQMTQTLEVGFEQTIKAIAWFHLIFALATLAASIVIL